MTRSRIRGVVAAAATPVLADFAPDLARLVTHCRALLDEGCDAVNLLGTTGEATAFSVEQRIRVMRAVADAGLPLDRFMVGSGVCALEDTVRLTRAACEIGFAGALVLPPFFYRGVPADGLVEYVSELVRRAAHPRLALYLYHIPQNTAVAWPIEVLVELKRRHPGELVGLKDSAGDLAYARAVAAALADFDVFPSSESALSGASADGYAGCISATVNVTAREAQSAWSGQGTEAGALAARKASELRALFVQYPLVSAVKAALAARYRDREWARVCLPLRPLEAGQASALRAALAHRTAQP